MKSEPKTEIVLDIPYDYKCRDYQVKFWEAMKEKRRAVLVWHRRAGKEKTCWNFQIAKASQRVGIYYYFFPHFSQGRKILWDGMDANGKKFLDHIPKQLLAGEPNATEMKIRLVNGSIIQIIGTNNVDSIVGTNPIGCVFSEYSLQNPVAWQLIRPILAENDGWAVFNFTPRGANHAKELYDMANTNDKWFSQLLTVDDTHAIAAEAIEAERAGGMSEDYIQQEFYCSFTLGVEGSYYARYMQEARDEERIGAVPWQKTGRVYTAWDIGIGDSTAIIFFQIVGNSIHIIDYYENHGEGLPHYAEVLFRKPYLYADHYAPHDIQNRHISSGMSTLEVGGGLGIKFTVLPTLQLRIEEGIEALRGIFPRIYFDESKTKHLIKCIENYRKEFDTNHNVYKNRPVHDWSSHGADAMRYVAIAVKRFIDSKGGPTDDEVQRLMDKYQPVFGT
jgi:phage terminase large subunit